MIGLTNAGGGSGGGLNFAIIGGLTQPVAPKENTIWVKTETKIPSWVFSPTAPTAPEGGTVFFKTALTSSVGFNALRKNEIAVLPTSAQQYIGGQWKNVESHAFIGGTWVQFSSEKYVVFEAGKGLSAGLTGFSNATYNSDKIVAKNPLYAGPGNGDSVISKEKIDVTQYNTATFSGINCGFSANGNTNWSSISVFVGSASTTIASTDRIGDFTMASNKTVTVDISNVTGLVEFGVKTYSSATYAVSFKNFNLNGIVFS